MDLRYSIVAEKRDYLTTYVTLRYVAVRYGTVQCRVARVSPVESSQSICTVISTVQYSAVQCSAVINAI